MTNVFEEIFGRTQHLKNSSPIDVVVHRHEDDSIFELFRHDPLRNVQAKRERESENQRKREREKDGKRQTDKETREKRGKGEQSFLSLEIRSPALRTMVFDVAKLESMLRDALDEVSGLEMMFFTARARVRRNETPFSLKASSFKKFLSGLLASRGGARTG